MITVYYGYTENSVNLSFFFIYFFTSSFYITLGLFMISDCFEFSIFLELQENDFSSYSFKLIIDYDFFNPFYWGSIISLIIGS